jgi:hypothetical protein
MTARFAALLLALASAGCVSPDEQAQFDAATCQRYGFIPNTPDFATCMQREQIARSYNTGSSVGIGVGAGSFGSRSGGAVGMGFGF